MSDREHQTFPAIGLLTFCLRMILSAEIWDTSAGSTEASGRRFVHDASAVPALARISGSVLAAVVERDARVRSPLRFTALAKVDAHNSLREFWQVGHDGFAFV
jgi:hypothetical protein